ncbi:MAG: hypothetical protein AAGA48_27460 [Myxococcota bacterium]
MLWWGWTVALAGDGLTAQSVVASAPDAEALIAACQFGCDVSHEELAEAFVVSALAAALEGRRDAVAVANAQALAPTATLPWEMMLPEAAPVPERWVVEWIDERTAKPTLTPVPLTLPTVVRLGLAGLGPGDFAGGRMDLEVRGSVGRFGVLAELSGARLEAIVPGRPGLRLPRQHASATVGCPAGSTPRSALQRPAMRGITYRFDVGGPRNSDPSNGPFVLLWSTGDVWVGKPCSYLRTSCRSRSAWPDGFGTTSAARSITERPFRA